MDRKLIERYFINTDREKQIWNDCIFIFDTSALLNFYNYSPDTKTYLFDKVFVKLAGRLWIPNHVEFEYLKNRQNVLKKPITEKYGKLEENEISSLKEFAKKLENELNNLKNKTKKKFAHPYFDQTIFKSFDLLNEKYQKEFVNLFPKLQSEIELRKKEILELEKKDHVLEAIEKHFQSGKSFLFDQILSICKDGEFRYKHKIPPGYEDGDGRNSKTGIQIFGDLIIWKQILEYARIAIKPIVYITDDVKSDWCYIEKSGSETRITRPKEELIKEMHDYAAVDFWMYTQSQFVHNIEKYYGIKPNEEILEDVEMNVKNVNVKFDKFYISGSKEFYLCLKFFEDGEVIYVPLVGDIRKEQIQKEVEKWFIKGHTNKGKYKIFENTIEIKVSGVFKAFYTGVIDGNKLILDNKEDNDHPLKSTFELLES